MFVNNQPATVAVLRQLAPTSPLIHAYNESLLSFDASTRLRLLDIPPMSQIDGDREKDLQMEEPPTVASKSSSATSRLACGLLDLWTFQARKIEEAGLQPGEAERLETERRVLANAEKIHSAAMNAFDLLYEARPRPPVTACGAKTHRRAGPVRANFRRRPVETARISVEDVGASPRDYAGGGIEASPEHLAEVEDRLAAIDRLKRKRVRRSKM